MHISEIMCISNQIIYVDDRNWVNLGEKDGADTNLPDFLRKFQRKIV